MDHLRWCVSIKQERVGTLSKYKDTRRVQMRTLVCSYLFVTLPARFQRCYNAFAKVQLQRTPAIRTDRKDISWTQAHRSGRLTRVAQAPQQHLSSRLSITWTRSMR